MRSGTRLLAICQRAGDRRGTFRIADRPRAIGRSSIGWLEIPARNIGSMISARCSAAQQRRRTRAGANEDCRSISAMPNSAQLMTRLHDDRYFAGRREASVRSIRCRCPRHSLSNVHQCREGQRSQCAEDLAAATISPDCFSPPRWLLAVGRDTRAARACATAADQSARALSAATLPIFHHKIIHTARLTD